MSVAYFNHQPSGCFWYRTKHPMELLGRNGIKVFEFNLETDIDKEIYDSIKAVQVYGIYPFSFSNVLQKLRDDGKKIIYDNDDNLDFIDTTNPFFYSVKKDSGSANELLKFADHLTVSTPFLKEHISKKTNLPITIIKNCYDPDEWTFKRFKKDKLRIGFSGSCTHVHDLLLVLPAIKKLQKKYDFQFIINGFGENTYENWLKAFRHNAPSEALEGLQSLEDAFNDINVDWSSYVPYQQFPRLLTEMSLDIAICPLRYTPFNNARSASKAMEYVLSGALCLASDTIPYRNDQNSILVDDYEWEEVLEYYIQNEIARKNEYSAQLQWTEENCKMDTQLSALKEVYGLSV